MTGVTDADSSFMSLRNAKALVAGALVLVLFGGIAVAIARAQQESRAQLEQRFALRGALGASFTASYVQSIVRAERRRAEDVLAEPRVSERSFLTVVDALEFQAAVLLDRRGRLLHVSPSKPELIGSNLGARYAHLRAAVSGKVGVSGVVRSAAEAKPIVAFAVPFRTAAGRRVISGALSANGTSLAAYFENALPFAGSELVLVDGAGALIIDSRLGAHGISELRSVDAGLAAAARTHEEGEYNRDGESRFFARHAVSGTDWSIIVSVPTAQLLAPISGFRAMVPWILFAALAFAAAGAAFLVWRLAEHRARLATSNDQLASSNAELRDLDRLKDEFVALVSHELRTPLTSIIGYVGALERGRAGVLSAEQRELLDVVGRNAQRLLGLIGDLLLAAKADAGKLELEKESVDLGAIARHAVETALPDAEEHGIHLTLSAPTAVQLVSDPKRLLQVLNNLVSNAIKFTPAGGSVAVSLTAVGPSAVFEVRDDGVGIPADERAKLFQRFFRASTATANDIPGTGLGLSIAQTIVELHGGTIECREGDDRGTTFVVSLPLGVALEAAA